MASFCGNCGAPLGEQVTFCGICGANRSAPGWPTQYQAVPATPLTANTSSSAPAPAKSNTLVKVAASALAVVVLGGVLAVAGVTYAIHKVSEKTPAATGLASLIEGRSDDVSSLKDPCHFLTRDDVSHAVGITIIRTEAQDDGCDYIAHGDPAEMISKHTASMLANQAKSDGQKIDARQQQMVQQITGAFFKQQESSDKNLAAEAAKGEVIVLAISFDAKNAKVAIQLNKAAFDHVKQGVPMASAQDSAARTGTGDLIGLGDEAYEMGGSMLLVRKGDTMARFLFNECPCSTDAIKPLAEKVVSQL